MGPPGESCRWVLRAALAASPGALSTAGLPAATAASDRHVFLRAVAPLQPIGTAAVSGRARYYLLKAGVNVPRTGSHTLRHSTVQRLVDANFDLKTTGDFVGHRSPRSTEIYAKVAVEALHEVALGDGEAVLK